MKKNKIETNNERFEDGLYSWKQRAKVSLFLLGWTLFVAMACSIWLLFFRNLSYYGYMFIAAFLGIMAIAIFFPAFGKKVDDHFGRVKNWVLPIFSVVLGSLLLFFTLSEFDILDLNPIIKFLVEQKG